MADSRKEAERAELHRTLWNIANDLRGSVDGWDIPNANITRVPAVLIQSRGINDAVYYDKPFTFKNEMWAYTADDLILVRYLYHYLKKRTFIT